MMPWFMRRNEPVTLLQDYFEHKRGDFDYTFKYLLAPGVFLRPGEEATPEQMVVLLRKGGKAVPMTYLNYVETNDE